MDMNDYQKRAMMYRLHRIEGDIPYAALGLAGEAGELADKVKKVLRDRNGKFNDLSNVEIAKELGDVLWYCALLASDLGYDLDFVAKMNLVKIADRNARNVIGGEGDNR